MKKSGIAATLLIILLSWNCSGDRKNESVRVISFNIRYDNPRDSLNAWPNRARMVCEFLKDEKPDLIGMQEVLSRQYDVIDSALTDYASVGIGRSDGARGGEMNPVFYRKDRFDMVRTKTFWLSGTPEVPGSQAWGANLPRIVTWIELADRKTGEHFYFFNTHYAHDSDSARVMSSRLLLHKVDSIASGFPFIITGDFNQLPTSRGYEILTGPAESVPLLKDAWEISEKTSVGPNYTFNGFSDRQGSGRIDYVFVKNGMKVLSHSIVVKKEQGIYISDHWPVIAEVSLK
jgi:endonuclease/exonuclease/phosphatase family metal-dependent hydrolase